MLINCDIGERGPAHAIDDQLMSYIDIANIACGGHAGSEQSVEYYYSLVKKSGVKPSVHLSYPDQKNFGREVMDIDNKTLLNSLDQQYKLLDEVKTLKFHGALYNEANINRKLAQVLMNWAKSVGIREVLSPDNSEITRCCSYSATAEDLSNADGSYYADGSCYADGSDQIKVIHEVFLDRQYIYEHNSLSLKNRKKPNALITNTDDAIKQYQNFINGFLVIDGKEHKVKSDTGCIHSDSDNALKLIRAIKSV